jgi:serine phosphatase RsbU (regulator of sigma subunit)/predicted DNA-binding transcriptional regulator AlpA
MTTLGQESRRSDALRNERRILEAAQQLLERSPSTTLAEIAAAAGVSRSTIYRRYRNRDELIDAISAPSRADAAPRPDSLVPTGALGRSRPVSLDAIQVFGTVPPPVLPEQLVAEAERIAGVPVALYVVDIDGSHLLRVAGSKRLSDRLEAPRAIGPELDASSISELRAALTRHPGTELVPLWLRGRATGVLISFGKPNGSLTELAHQASAAITLADRYTDTFAKSQRRKQPKAAAEIQQSLLPPRISRVTGGEVAGNVVPSYEVAGDWFDVVENLDGIWITLADGLRGSGTRATASAAVALGALRASRRSDAGISEALIVMHQTLKEMPGSRSEMTALIARWDPATHQLILANCGHVPPVVIRPNNKPETLRLPESRGLGGRASPKPVEHTTELKAGDRLILVSDGVIGSGKGKAGLGAKGVIEAALLSGTATAADTVRHVHGAVLDAAGGDLTDDATVVCLSVS